MSMNVVGSVQHKGGFLPDIILLIILSIILLPSGSPIKVAVNTIVPRSPLFCFLYPKIQTATNI